MPGVKPVVAKTPKQLAEALPYLPRMPRSGKCSTILPLG